MIYKIKWYEQNFGGNIIYLSYYVHINVCTCMCVLKEEEGKKKKNLVASCLRGCISAHHYCDMGDLRICLKQRNEEKHKRVCIASLFVYFFFKNVSASC